MSIESCMLKNSLTGYQLKRKTKTTVLVDADAPNKGYTSTEVTIPLICMKINFNSINLKETSLSTTKYILEVLCDSNVLTIAPILETDTITDSDEVEREILFVEEFRVGNNIKKYTLYIG